jgi:mRNA interferase MazF
MERFVKGDVVVIPFPFSDLSGSKRRPALVIRKLLGDDIILCQITASRSDNYSIDLTNCDFTEGNLPLDSFIRASRLFTADSNIIVQKRGKLNQLKINEVIEKIISIVTS